MSIPHSRLAGGRKRELPTPASEQRGTKSAMRRIGKLAVAGDDRRSLAPRLLEQARVAQEIDRAELGQPGLSGAKELARPAQLQVDLGDPEAVVRRGHGVDAALGLLGATARRQQDGV